MLVALSIVYTEVGSFGYHEQKEYWVWLKLLYYLLTDLVFLALLNLIVREQDNQNKIIQKHSEESRAFPNSELERTLFDM